jgi:cell division protein FtsL
MAPATAPRRAPVPGSGPESAPPRLRVVGPPTRQRRPWSIRPTLIAAVTLVLGSLLAVAVAQAYMTQQQVRLTAVQTRLAAQAGEYRDLELRVAELSNPAHVVGAAQQQGLTVPSQITDLPEVTVPSTTVAPTASNSQKKPTASARHGTHAGAPGAGGT